MANTIMTDSTARQRDDHRPALVWEGETRRAAFECSLGQYIERAYRIACDHFPAAQRILVDGIMDHELGAQSFLLEVQLPSTAREDAQQHYEAFLESWLDEEIHDASRFHISLSYFFV